jgi:4-hydroxybenzoate polyprenyltransferase
VAAGRISKKAAWIFVLISCAVFVFSAWMINTLCFVLSFPAMLLLFGYSYSKRFTYASHFVLGLALALAPIGAWIAVSGRFDFRILALAAALVFQIAAFDILYSKQDTDFDRKNSLFSIPSVFGEEKAMKICFALFALAGLMLFLTGFLFKLTFFYFICAALISATYFSGLALFKKSGLLSLGTVFFYMNAASSILILLAVLPNAVFP